MFKDLDPILHSQLRLAIMSLLISVKEAEFTFLREKTNSTAGNLSVQIQKLKDAGYIDVTKQFKDNYPQTICKITRQGIISFAMQGIIKSDKWFTIPGVIIITAGGITAAVQIGLPLLRTGWIFWSLVLFSVSGIVFGWKLAPLQKKIVKLTRGQDEKSFNHSLYCSYLLQWERWGFVALLTPLAAMIMMVLKIPARSVF